MVVSGLRLGLTMGDLRHMRNTVLFNLINEWNRSSEPPTQGGGESGRGTVRDATQEDIKRMLMS